MTGSRSGGRVGNRGTERDRKVRDPPRLRGLVRSLRPRIPRPCADVVAIRLGSRPRVIQVPSRPPKAPTNTSDEPTAPNCPSPRRSAAPTPCSRGGHHEENSDGSPKRNGRARCWKVSPLANDHTIHRHRSDSRTSATIETSRDAHRVASSRGMKAGNWKLMARRSSRTASASTRLLPVLLA